MKTITMESQVSFIVGEESDCDTDTETDVDEEVYGTTEKIRALAVASTVHETQGLTTDASRRVLRLVK